MTQRRNASGVSACATVALVLAGCAANQSGYNGKDNTAFASQPACQSLVPKLYLPDHHDSIWGVWLDNGLAPLFMKIRDDLPDTHFTEPLYRSATCVSTSGPQRGAFSQSR